MLGTNTSFTIQRIITEAQVLWQFSGCSDPNYIAHRKKPCSERKLILMSIFSSSFFLLARKRSNRRSIVCLYIAHGKRDRPCMMLIQKINFFLSQIFMAKESEKITRERGKTSSERGKNEAGQRVLICTCDSQQFISITKSLHCSESGVWNGTRATPKRSVNSYNFYRFCSK